MAPEMRQIIQEFWSETGTLRQTLQSQMLEALMTGGIGARIPIIQRAEEEQRRAVSQAMREAEAGLAQKGLSGTPFGEQILAEMGLTGQMNIAGIGPQMVSEWLGVIPGYVQGGTQAVMGATSGSRESEGKSWQI